MKLLPLLDRLTVENYTVRTSEFRLISGAEFRAGAAASAPDAREWFFTERSLGVLNLFPVEDDGLVRTDGDDTLTLIPRTEVS